MGASEIAVTASLGSAVIAIFSAIFLFYTSSFLMKQRKKEFGLYCVLGMERRHIARILLYETLILAVSGIVLGLLFGTLLDYLAYLLLMFLMGSPGGAGFALEPQRLYRHRWILCADFSGCLFEQSPADSTLPASSGY